KAPDGSTVAIKDILLRYGLKEQVQREIQTLRTLAHAGIPYYIEDFASRSGRERYQMLVQEFIDGQTLEAEFESKRYTPLDVVTIIEELAFPLSNIATSCA
ncbi:MAG: hypothetical protein HN348_25090, partial [Proteobacteria bacterium]|nr:hypothetical protein [Pseudomonadota bacterium]